MNAPIMSMNHRAKTSRLTPLFVTLASIGVALVSFAAAQEKNANSPGKAKAKSQPGNLITKIFHVPPTFIPYNKGTVRDPFASDSELHGKAPRKTRSAREVLEKAGISFPPGSSVTYNSLTGSLIVKNTPDQLELVEVYIQPMGPDPARQVNVIVEFIEVDGNLYHDWMFQNRIKENGNALREAVREWVKTGRGTILETSLLTARSGNRAKTESIREYIYPTEMDPPEIPNNVNLSGPATEDPTTASTPTAFEVRDLGTTVEVDPILGPDNITIDINLSPEIVHLNGFTDWPQKGDPFFTISMPRFYTMKITTQVTVTSGRYAILGSHRPLHSADPKRRDPIVLQFLRADVATIPGH